MLRLLKEKSFFCLVYVCLKDRRVLWLLLGPILPIPLLFVSMDTKFPNAPRCAYASVLMALYWVTKPIPIAIVAFMPLLLYPILGISSAECVSASYFNDTLFLLLTSMMFASALEKWNVHRRIALKFLIWVGPRPVLLMGGFVGITAFLSMWISNTATTAMMTPLALAVIEHIEKGAAGDNKLMDRDVDIDSEEDVTLEDPDSEELRRTQLLHDPDDNLLLQIKQYSTGLLLGVCYGASLGGTATLIGTGSNLIIFTQVRESFPGAPHFDFGKWFRMAFPLALVVVLILWLILIVKYARKTTFNLDISVLKRHYIALGNVNLPQIVLGIDFLFMIILWFTRVLFDGGWSALFEKEFVTDGTVCVLGVLILFAIPSRVDNSTILDNRIFKEISWDIVFLLAGGFGLAHGIQVSGLSELLSCRLDNIEVHSYWLLVIICLLTVFMTEFTSNVATISVLSPILIALSVTQKQNPLFLLIPAALSSSYAFMLPIATPPNAIVFSSGRVKMRDMVTTGALLNLLGIFLVPAAMLLFSLDDTTLSSLPPWANQTAPNGEFIQKTCPSRPIQNVSLSNKI